MIKGLTAALMMIVLPLASRSSKNPGKAPIMANVPNEVYYGMDNHHLVGLEAGTYSLQYDIVSTIAQLTSVTVTVRNTANDSIMAQAVNGNRLLFHLSAFTNVDIHFHVNNLVNNTLILNVKIINKQ